MQIWKKRGYIFAIILAFVKRYLHGESERGEDERMGTGYEPTRKTTKHRQEEVGKRDLWQRMLVPMTEIPRYTRRRTG